MLSIAEFASNFNTSDDFFQDQHMQVEEELHPPPSVPQKNAVNVKKRKKEEISRTAQPANLTDELDEQIDEVKRRKLNNH